MHGALRIYSIWKPKPERHQIIFHTLDRTGAFQHIIGRPWKKIITNGGKIALVKWLNISMHTGLIISLVSSVFGKYLLMQYRVCWDILILHYPTGQKRSAEPVYLLMRKEW